MTEYKEMSTEDLWKEITYVIQATHFIEADKELFMKLIEEYSYRGNELNQPGGTNGNKK